MVFPDIFNRFLGLKMPFPIAFIGNENYPTTMGKTSFNYPTILGENIMVT